MNSPHREQLNQKTSTDSSNIILARGFNIVSQPRLLRAGKGEEGALQRYFCNIWNGNRLLPLTSGRLLMHLCLTMDRAAAVKSDTQLHVEDKRRAGMDCVDLPRSSLTDREDTDLLRCQDATGISSPFKYRRYGYAFFSLIWKWHSLNEVKRSVCLIKFRKIYYLLFLEITKK